MALNSSLSDDYVAALLASEAKSNNAKYITQGLQAYLPSRLETYLQIMLPELTSTQIDHERAP